MSLPSKEKLLYVDNLRIFLTALVIMHHAFVTYGAPGSWYYNEKANELALLIPMTLVVAVDQSFFMGFFFFLSAYFAEASYARKGASQFLADRFIRLGVPLLFYSFILSPVMNYLVYYFGYDHHISFLDFLGGYDDWIDFGVLWFTAALLLFSVVYVLVRSQSGHREYTSTALPSNTKIFLFAMALGLISFAVRLYFPVGWTLKPFGFQLGHFTQYIALFCLGIIAARNQWLTSIDWKRGRQWIPLAAVLIVIFFPLMFIVKQVTNSSLDAFQGGLNWTSLMASVWEQLGGFSIIMALTGFAHRYWNRQTPMLEKLSRQAYATYIFHPLVLISISLVLKTWDINKLVKALIVAPIAVVGSFLLAGVILRIPPLRKIV